MSETFCGRNIATYNFGNVLMNLTELTAKAATPNTVLYDDAVRGLHLRCFCARKVFYLYYRSNDGTQRRPKLGDYGILSVHKARILAKNMLGGIAMGNDPALVKKVSTYHTLQDLWDQYWQHYAPRKKSASQDMALWRLHLSALRKLEVSSIQFDDIAKLHASLRDNPFVANRAMSLLSTMFNFACQQLRWAPDHNPTKGIKRYPEPQRTRYATPAELKRIADILRLEEINNPQSVAFIRLMLLTGARKSEIANARWEQLCGNQLILNDHKTDYSGKSRVIYLSSEALTIIAGLPKTHDTILSIKSPQALWEKIRNIAGCSDLRLHDLRHTFASMAVSEGFTLVQIGALLGHSSVQTTARYAHLMKDKALEIASCTSTSINNIMSGGE